MALPKSTAVLPKTDSAAVSQISETLRRLDKLADEAPSLGAYYPPALALAVATLEASWGAVWSGMDRHRPAIVWSSVTPGDRRGQHDLLDPGLATRVREWANSPDEGLMRGGRAPVLMASVEVESRLLRTVTFGFEGAVPPAAEPGLRRFAERFSEAAARVEGRALIAKAATQASGWSRYADVASAAAIDAPLERVARELAEAGAAYIPCGRLSLTKTLGGRQRVVAISGIERYAKRAESVAALERLATSVVRGKQPMFSSGGGDLAPQVQRDLDAYYDLTAAKSVVVTPLLEPGGNGKRLVGAAVFERFESPALEEASDEVQRFVELAEKAFARASRLRAIPLLDGLLRLADRAGRFGIGWTLKRLAVLAVAAVALAGLVLGRGELTVEAYGELTPRQLRHVFAPSDGLVEAVHVRHGETVKAGTPFVMLSSSDLDLQQEETLGELSITEEELANLKTAGFGVTGVADALQKRRELSAQQELLELRRENLKKRLALIDGRLDELKVVTPQAGTVVTWDIEKQLSARPVRRGDLLGTVADLDGEWMLKLRVPDRLVGHLPRSASEEDASFRPVSLNYLVASEPEQTYEATVARFSPASQVDPADGTSYVLVEATIPRDVTPTRRIGARVKARLQCGPQPLYYVWFHEVYEEVRRYFF